MVTEVTRVKYEDCQYDGYDECWNNELAEERFCTLLECPTCKDNRHLNSKIKIGTLLECPKCGTIFQITQINIGLQRA